MWTVEVLPEAHIELLQVGPEDARKIARFLKRLELDDNPRSQGQAISFLWRYTVVDAYQVIAAIYENERRILITAVRHLPF
jgi:mRNA-degrading endonuclease RelE of RelBE toxin-antitoxin system